MLKYAGIGAIQKDLVFTYFLKFYIITVIKAKQHI